ncbi:MAG TPA: O-antigen ligase family protein [Pelobium sp.]|nr:O-antigen ligase family protein [Pelobium sp.]
MNKSLAKRLCVCIIYFVIGLLYLWLPFVDLKYLAESNQSSKYLVFIYSICVTSFFFLLYLAICEFKLVVKWIDILLLVLLVFIGINRYYIQPHFGFSIRYQELCGLAVLYLVMKIGNITTFYFLIICMIIGAILQTIYGQLQLIGALPSHHSLFNVTGGFSNPGPYAGFLASVFPAVLGLVIYKEEIPFLFNNQKQFKGKLFYSYPAIKNIAVTGLVGMLLILPSTQSRSAWLAVIISSIYLLIAKYKFTNTLHKYCFNTKRRLLGCLLFCFFIFFSSWALYSFKKNSSNGRILIWKVTARLIEKKTWTGEGFDRFKYAYMNEQANYFREHQDQTEAFIAGDVSYGFNEFLQFTAENGIPAMLLMLSILVLVLFTKSHCYSDKSQNNSSQDLLLKIAKGGITSIMVFSLFSYPAQILPIKLNLLLYLGIVAYCSKNVWLVNLPIKKKIIDTLIRTAFCLSAIFILLNSSVKYRKIDRAFENWNIAYDNYTNGLYAEALNYYKKAYPVLSQSGGFLMQYGKALSMANHHQLAVKILLQSTNYSNTSITQTAMGDSYKALGKWKLAEQAYSEAEFMVPGRLYPSYLLATLYRDTHQTSKAVKKAKEVLTKQIKIKSPAVNEIRQEMESIINEKK